MSSTALHIAVDCMSGDFGPRSNLQAVRSMLEHYQEDIHLHLCGQALDIKELIPHSLHHLATIHPTEHTIPSDLKPSAALRLKEITSLHKMLELVADNTASVAVSSANTGAYMAISLKKIGLMPGVKRPAIAKLVPSMYEDSPCSQTLLLDLGANVHCSSDILISFATIAKDYLFKTEHLVSPPKIGILNIGSEAGKGTDELQATFAHLSNMPGIDFIGFVEGDDLLRGIADIIICDGFHGNIALKTLEGTIKGFYNVLKSMLRKSSLKSKIGAFFLEGTFKQTFGETYNPKKYNGALFLGLNGNVIKSHGSADNEAFAYAIKAAYQIAKSTTNLAKFP